MSKRFLAGVRPLVIAYRGASGLAPENTMPAIRRAVEMGADAIALDVRMTQDSQVVVLHNATVGSLLQGNYAGKISEMSYAYLRRFDLGYHFTQDDGESFPFRGKGLHVLRLRKVLKVFPEMPLILDLRQWEPGLVPMVISVLREFDRLDKQTILVNATDRRILQEVRQLAPQVASGLSSFESAQLLGASVLRSPWLIRINRTNRTNRTYGTALTVPIQRWGVALATPQVVATAHELGVDVFSKATDDAKEMKRLLDTGVDGIYTRYPHRLRMIVNARKSW
jgi:glycerophosphoryl diester phosphodiesterase